ncbi:aldehyde dehydrogenase [Sphingomonas sp. Root710]|uniref:aldehyde dehydrogenase family protein n=1 Tax=Sphingomonas sp. Root710 TaxID=1736594 RepID=UPI0006F8423C|nr:aldehyde dehydrogenase family protein [Sphingomonas sp. Root710]KRB86515.1 aldehyde dehydrogenase [Sphingomonas sp. Root710]
MSEAAIQVRHLIGGEWLGSAGGEARTNPSDTSELVATLPASDVGIVDQAVAAARTAQPLWANATPEFRADCLHKAGELVLARAKDLGRLLSREEGKTLAEGIGEVVRAGRILRYFAGEAIRRHGMTLDSVRAGVDVQTFRDPLGVVGLITPWNFPIAIPAWKSAPALAFGNTVVMKPASHTAAIAATLAAIYEEAGMPPGVFNLIVGPGSIGGALVRHPGVDAVSFTGSQTVGGIVAADAATRQARFQLEMGGKNPLVVLDDADLDRAVQIAVDGAFFGTGQRCTASSRLIVTDAIHDRFLAAMASRMDALRVGNALDPETHIGPAVSETQQAQDIGFVERAIADGARLISGGDPVESRTRGWFVRPTLLADTTAEMEINTSEVFGPVASVLRVKDYDAALETANHGEFGLSAGIVTQSLKHSRHFQRSVRAGMVMVNLPTAGVDYHVPFGGMGRSSFGSREQGFAAVEFYTQIRTVYATA